MLWDAGECSQEVGRLHQIAKGNLRLLCSRGEQGSPMEPQPTFTANLPAYQKP